MTCSVRGLRQAAESLELAGSSSQVLQEEGVMDEMVDLDEARGKCS